ncbi:phenylalanyl-tRNA synthetase subunit beta [Flagelloscypha sp. PMI_526]|nr:phenylalanyl-tRNA synthetase subunit beta [Flagelloscypha sp. PMI_526]
MPTVAVDKADLFDRLGRVFTTEEFDNLCFEYGLELDEDTTEEVESAIKKGLPADRPQLKIEIPANRYDLLCIEGISRALRVFLQQGPAPQYRLVLPKGGEKDILPVTCTEDTKKIRPYFASAILRNVKFTERSYASFIDLQDKLHQNICRRRQLVAIGTHDLDTLKPPFRYDARSPKDINFVPLNKTKSYTAEELMTLYESDRQLSKFLPIIRDSPVYPIIYDANDTVLSMPPIINSDHSKITLNTTNVFIDVTATDQVKLEIVVNMVATMFSEHCAEPFTIEPVRIIYPDGSSRLTPDISGRDTVAHTSYINGYVVNLLQRMSLEAKASATDPDVINVHLPPTRPDILHECDVAYGFNNLPDIFPRTNTIAQMQAISQVSDVIRKEWALAGWIEVLPLLLCSHEENFEFLNRKDDGTTAAKIGNPKTLEFQVVRTTLLPGLLKTVRENKSHALPIKIFETGDIVLKDSSREHTAGAVWCNKAAGFEMVHGMLDRAMKMLEVPYIVNSSSKAETGYYIKESSDPAFFEGRAATIYYRPKPAKPGLGAVTDKVARVFHLEDKEIGVLGVLHPTVLTNFEIQYPCSALEFTLEPFKKQMQRIWTNEEEWR